jgi:hypothetical protein
LREDGCKHAEPTRKWKSWNSKYNNDPNDQKIIRISFRQVRFLSNNDFFFQVTNPDEYSYGNFSSPGQRSLQLQKRQADPAQETLILAVERKYSVMSLPALSASA